MLERFECSSAIEIRNGIMFNFYPGLPHIPSIDERMRGVVSSISVSESLSEHACREHINFHQQLQRKNE